MELYLETELKKQADSSTLAMLELWHTLVKEKTNADFDVLVGNRHNHPQLKSFNGNLYTAYPQIVNSRPCLVSLLQNLVKRC
jgi:hypothetical protein